MNKLFIIKIGGNVLDNPEALKKFLADFASIKEPKILIHGGGKIATKLGEQLGIQSNYINGRRITDSQTLDVVTMVYGGLVNKQIVASLQQLGCNALGLTGADGNVIKAVKRPIKDIDYGYVGDIKPDSVNSSLLYFLLKQNTVPVFAPLTHADGTMLNTNADTIASVLAVALGKHFDVRLIFCFEKKGVLRDVNDPDSVIRHLPKSSYNDLLTKNVFADGILPKLENAFAAIHAGVKEVLIGEASDLTKNTGLETEGTLITS
ncbi:acetylglutamate kinase [Chryseosolibacter indicus]|uniref:Acetylglutamate kinase n=1 Tax=Chryseosolibacter indicus TaxID=2782351 RepID=A0ABS5VS03_9BACT|nr:acetylglutamate kinase [Chryseosolibacter indicus]MBT1703549.1 acetylglutamate kinase [Chryseosolibacter indicus]